VRTCREISSAKLHFNDGKIYCLFVLLCFFISMNREKKSWKMVDEQEFNKYTMYREKRFQLQAKVVTGINFSISLRCDKVLENVNFSFFHSWSKCFFLSHLTWFIFFDESHTWNGDTSYIFLPSLPNDFSFIYISFICERYKFHSNRQSGHFNAIFFCIQVQIEYFNKLEETKKKKIKAIVLDNGTMDKM
jgi:hypothetical protein